MSRDIIAIACCNSVLGYRQIIPTVSTDNYYGRFVEMQTLKEILNNLRHILRLIHTEDVLQDLSPSGADNFKLY